MILEKNLNTDSVSIEKTGFNSTGVDLTSTKVKAAENIEQHSQVLSEQMKDRVLLRIGDELARSKEMFESKTGEEGYKIKIPMTTFLNTDRRNSIEIRPIPLSIWNSRCYTSIFAPPYIDGTPHSPVSTTGQGFDAGIVGYEASIPEEGRLELFAYTYANDPTADTVAIPTTTGFNAFAQLRRTSARLNISEYQKYPAPNLESVCITARIGATGSSNLVPRLANEPNGQFTTSLLVVRLIASDGVVSTSDEKQVYYSEVKKFNTGWESPDPPSLSFDRKFELKVILDPIQRRDLVRVEVGAELLVIVTTVSRNYMRANFGPFNTINQSQGSIQVPMVVLGHSV